MAAPAVADLVRRLERRGVTFEARAGRLRVRAPAGTLTPADRDELAVCRDTIVQLLATHPCAECGQFSFPRPMRCYWCRHGTR